MKKNSNKSMKILKSSSEDINKDKLRTSCKKFLKQAGEYSEKIMKVRNTRKNLMSPKM